MNDKRQPSRKSVNDGYKPTKRPTPPVEEGYRPAKREEENSLNNPPKKR